MDAGLQRTGAIFTRIVASLSRNTRHTSLTSSVEKSGRLSSSSCRETHEQAHFSEEELRGLLFHASLWLARAPHTHPSAGRMEIVRDLREVSPVSKHCRYRGEVCTRVVRKT